MPKHRAGAGFAERPQAMRVVAATGSGGQLCKNAVFSGVQETFQCLQCLNVKCEQCVSVKVGLTAVPNRERDLLHKNASVVRFRCLFIAILLQTKSKR